MDPVVKKLLEGNPEDEKYQAIAFAFACLLTGPRANQYRGDPFNSGKIFKALSTLRVSSCVLPGGHVLLNRIYPSFQKNT